MPHPLRRGKMAPDHRSQPRAPSCQQRTDRKWQGRGVGWREVAGGGKTTLIDFPNDHLVPRPNATSPNTTLG